MTETLTAEEAMNIDTKKPMSFESKIEEEIIEKGLTAPRVTKAQIDELYSQLEFIYGKVSETRIMCSALLNGFVIADGFSACIDPKNFDEQIGMQIASKKCSMAAYDKFWELEGYRLARSLNADPSAAPKSDEKKIIVPKNPKIII